MTAIITYTHADASTMDFDATNVVISWQFPNKVIDRQNNKIGITSDANQEYRVVECTAYLTGDQLNTLNSAMMPATSPTYDATDPKITVYLDGDTTFIILCAVTALKATHQVDNKWIVQVQFTERST